MSADKPYGWIGVDLDGTLAHYDKWRGENHIGDPIPEMVERIKAWLVRGMEVRIFTARVGGLGWMNNSCQRLLIQDWLEHSCGLPRLEVTATKDYQMVELWDDRAVSVVPNSGKSEREVFLCDPMFKEEIANGFPNAMLYFEKPERVLHGLLNPIRLAGKP